MKKPGRFLAPIVIAGITVGFLASAYKFVFNKSNSSKQATAHTRNSENSSNDSKGSN